MSNAALRYHVSGRSRVVGSESSTVGWSADIFTKWSESKIEGQLTSDPRRIP